MANRYAVASGNWSNTAIWDGGTLPTIADDVRPNNFSVTIDQNITVNSLRNDASSPAVAGGTFTLTGNYTLNIVSNIQCFATSLLTYNGTGTAYITGTTAATSIISSTTTNSTSTVIHSGTGTLIVDMVINSAVATENNRQNITVTGGGTLTCLKDVRKPLPATALTSHAILVNTTNGAVLNLKNVYGSVSQTYTIRTTSICTINVVGDIVGGTVNNGATGAVIETQAQSTINVTGNIYGFAGTQTAAGGGSIFATGGNSVINVIGNIIGVTSRAISVSSTTSIINITGSVIGGSVDSAIVVGAVLYIIGNVTGGNGGGGVNSNFNCIITGTITGGTANGSVGVILNSGTLDHIGVAQASLAGSAIFCGSPTTSVITCTGPFLKSGYTVAIASQTLRINAAYNPYFEFIKTPFVEVTYVNQSSLSFPATTNVRNGITYGSGVYTGTMIVPSPNYVRFGIPTDNTIGTAIITAADLFNEIAISPNPLAVRLRTVSTVGTVGQQLITYNNL